MRQGAGVVDRVTRRLIAVAGSDRVDYLQGLLTNDVAALGTGDGCYSVYLTPQGRLICDLEVFNVGDLILLDVYREVKEALVERFEELIFTEDVDITDWSEDWTSYGVHGPSAMDVVTAALTGLSGNAEPIPGVRGLQEHQCRRVAAGGADVIVARTDELGELGLVVYTDRDHAARLHGALMGAGGIEVGQDMAEVVRIESGRPAFPVDMDHETIPLEAGIEDRALSLTKGCYVGQEVIIRILHRGKGRVARKLVGLMFGAASDRIGGSSVVPQRGAALRHGDVDVGRITSAVLSPALGQVVALGYLPRDLADPGTRVEVALPGVRAEGVVTARPFVRPASRRPSSRVSGYDLQIDCMGQMEHRGRLATHIIAPRSIKA